MKPSTPTEKSGAAKLRRYLPAGLLVGFLGLLSPIGAVAGEPVQVFAEFASAAGEEGVREARLWLDGEEVTGGAAVSAIRISYALPGDFPTGSHEARVVVVDSLGRSHEKTWSFEVSESRPELVAFFTDRLTVVLDSLPRQTLGDRVRVSGISLPHVEIELRRDGLLVGRTDTSPSGRFSLPVGLEEGDNQLAVTAHRPLTGEEGREVRVRLQRLLLEESDPRVAEDLPGRQGRGGPSVPEGPTDRTLPGRDLDAAVVITRPGEGDFVRNGRVTVLGLAPAGWTVTVLVNGEPRGEDQVNSAGHFTVPQVRLDDGSNRLIAEAEEPETGRVVTSAPVMVWTEPPGQGLTFTTSVRRNQTVRDAVWRLEGRAGPGAELEVEINGLLVMTDIAGPDGRFALLLPLERGLNRIVVEAFGEGSLRGERSRPFTLRRVGSARRGEALVITVPPLERKELPGRGTPSRLRPLR